MLTDSRAPWGPRTPSSTMNQPITPPTANPTTGGGFSIGERVPRRSRLSWGPRCTAESRRVGGDIMETVDMGLVRPTRRSGSPDAASIPDTPRWLTHELCKARARRPGSWSWLVARGARRLRAETATSVAGPTRRCCTSSSRSTGRPSSSEPSSPAACLTSSSRSSRPLPLQLSAPFLERALTILTANEADPTELAETRFTLARALWDTGPKAGRYRQRAKTLAGLTHTAYAEAGERSAKPLEEVQAWQREHAS
jgi:hypothetical protein